MISLALNARDTRVGNNTPRQPRLSNYWMDLNCFAVWEVFLPLWFLQGIDCNTIRVPGQSLSEDTSKVLGQRLVREGTE